MIPDMRSARFWRKWRASALIASVGVLAAVGLWAAPQDAPQSPGPGAGQQTPPVFRGGVDIVHVSVAVTDQEGRPVNDLAKDDFSIFENGNRREVMSFRGMAEPSAEPIGLGLVLDVSGSMRVTEGRNSLGTRLSTLKIAVERLIVERVRRSDDVYILSFAATNRLVHPWTADKESIVAAVRRLSNVDIGANTALYDAIANALPVSSSGRHKKQVMLVISDGNDNWSKTPRATVAKAARDSAVAVYALVVGDDSSRTFGERTVSQAAGKLSEITAPTGGLTRDVHGFHQLEDAILAIGKEFTQQYEIGFARSQADGQYHEIVVGVRRQNVTIRHRRGYLAD